MHLNESRDADACDHAVLIEDYYGRLICSHCEADCTTVQDIVDRVNTASWLQAVRASDN